MLLLLFPLLTAGVHGEGPVHCTEHSDTFECKLNKGAQFIPLDDSFHRSDLKSHTHIRLHIEQEMMENATPICLRINLSTKREDGTCPKTFEDGVWHQSMIKQATFIVSKDKYEKGFCLEVTTKDVNCFNKGNKECFSSHDRDPDEDTCLISKDYDEKTWNGKLKVSLKGNGRINDNYIASLLTLGIYFIFFIIFASIWIWWIIVKCLKAQGCPTWYQAWTCSKPCFNVSRRVADLNKLEMVTCTLPEESMSKIFYLKHKKKSKLTWQILLATSALYLIPSLQMVIAASRLYTLDKDMDHCYYNFLCLKRDPLPTWLPFGGEMIMWNNLLSNAGYIILGVLFLVVVRQKQKLWNENVLYLARPGSSAAFSSLYELEPLSQALREGLPGEKVGTNGTFVHFYSMGLTLALIGVMSLCYHICPTRVTFQFDTTYMYALAIFMVISLYKRRHPDLTPDAIAAFTMLACVVTFGAMSVNIHYIITNHNVAWWTIRLSFMAAYLWSGSTIAVMFYGLDKLDGDDNDWILDGRWTVFLRWGCNLCRRNMIVCPPSQTKSVTRAVFVIFFAILNIVGGCTFIFIGPELPTVILCIFIANCALYLTFYIVMKLAHGEGPTVICWVFLFFALVFLGAAAFYFSKKVKLTDKTPAVSKHANKECVSGLGLNFWDYHDIWHFLSSFGLFFMLMFLLTIDDDIAEKNQKDIYVW